MTQPTLLFITRDCLLRPTSGGANYAMDILHYLEMNGVEVEVVLLTPSRISHGFLLPAFLPGTKMAVRSPGFVRLGAKNVHFLGLALLPLRVLLAKFSGRLKGHAVSRQSVRILEWLHEKTFPTWPREILSYFEADPTMGETRFVAGILKRKSFSTVIYNYICLTPLLRLTGRSSSMKRLVLAHDVWHLRAEKLKEAGLTPDLKEWHKDEESARYQAADRVIGISWDERADFIEMVGETKVMTLPKAIRLRDAGNKVVDKRCLFVGTDMPSNLDGVNWLVNEIWPLVRRVHPQATLHICGTICRKLGIIPEGVALRGLVDDLKREYEQSMVVVVPLRAGSGVKIKLTEAIGFQRCCVSTKCGIEGLPAKDESGVLVSDDAEGFAAHMNALLGQKELRQTCLANMNDWAATHLNADAAYGPLLRLIRTTDKK